MTNKPLHPTIKALLIDIEAYCARAGMSRTNFGKKVVQSGNFIPRLEAGQQPKLETIDRVYTYINKQTKAARPFK